jgi:hypothetical protein
LLRTALAGGFGGQLKAGLASAGVIEGTAAYETAVTVIQTALDSSDAINYAAEAASKMPIIHNQVVGDGTVPNTVAGAPLSGSEIVNRLMGLQSYSSTQVNPDGLHGVARFLPPAFHESLFRTVDDDPPFTVAPQVTIEMQGQAASFLVSGGTFVQVSNPDVLVPVLNISDMFQNTPDMNLGSGKKGRGSSGPGDAPTRVTADRRIRQEGTNK